MGYILTPPTTLPHPDGFDRLLPGENATNAYFARAWETYVDSGTGTELRLDRVVNVPDNGQTRTINIYPGSLAAQLDTISGIDAVTAAARDYEIRIAMLELAEELEVPDLAPLDFATEAADYAAWFPTQFEE